MIYPLKYLSLERVTVNRFGIACSLADLPGSGFSSKICCTFCQSDFLLIAVWCSSLKYLLSIVFFTDLCIPKINRTSFLHECVPAIFLVPENTANSSSPPKIFPFRRFDALLGQRGGNFCGVAPSKQLS